MGHWARVGTIESVDVGAPAAIGEDVVYYMTNVDLHVTSLDGHAGIVPDSGTVSLAVISETAEQGRESAAHLAGLTPIGATGVFVLRATEFAADRLLPIAFAVRLG